LPTWPTSGGPPPRVPSALAGPGAQPERVSMEAGGVRASAPGSSLDSDSDGDVFLDALEDLSLRADQRHSPGSSLTTPPFTPGKGACACVGISVAGAGAAAAAVPGRGLRPGCYVRSDCLPGSG
jgi:hypothetical protein